MGVPPFDPRTERIDTCRALRRSTFRFSTSLRASPHDPTRIFIARALNVLLPQNR